jgi:hypothetical protein
MQVEVIGKPIRYRFRSGKEIVLKPGVPTALPDAAVKQLLARAGDRVKIVGSTPPHPPSMDTLEVCVEPAATNAQPVYWQAKNGCIYGPGKPEFLARVGYGNAVRFFVLVQHEGQLRFIESDRLRSP